MNNGRKVGGREEVVDEGVRGGERMEEEKMDCRWRHNLKID